MWTLIGCPVYRREWILPLWFKAIKNQDVPLDQLGFIFLTGPDDNKTVEELLKFHGEHPEVKCFDILIDKDEEHMSHPDGHRSWGRHRYNAMASFRNQLLDKVNCYNPDRYYSLDTDILLEDPSTITQLIELTEVYDAVSTLLFMTPEGTQFPSVMTWLGEPGDRAFRHMEYKLGHFFQSDIIMASVMMSPKVYKTVRYEYHPQGEDLGWSAQCARAGLKLYSASYLYTPHIMSTMALEEYLTVGDTRGDAFKESR